MSGQAARALPTETKVEGGCSESAQQNANLFGTKRAACSESVGARGEAIRGSGCKKCAVVLRRARFQGSKTFASLNSRLDKHRLHASSQRKQISDERNDMLRECRGKRQERCPPRQKSRVQRAANERSRTQTRLAHKERGMFRECRDKK